MWRWFQYNQLNYRRFPSNSSYCTILPRFLSEINFYPFIFFIYIRLLYLIFHKFQWDATSQTPQDYYYYYFWQRILILNHEEVTHSNQTSSEEKSLNNRIFLKMNIMSSVIKKYNLNFKFQTSKIIRAIKLNNKWNKLRNYFCIWNTIHT